MPTRAALALIALASLSGCGCSEPEAPVAIAPPVPAAPEPTTETASEPLGAGRVFGAPAQDEARAWLARLRDARRLARTDPAQAYSAFASLVAERPSDARLRCEAGFVASRAGLLDHAERDIRTALAGWARPPSRRTREPLAMCLYNRGLVAQQRGDVALAASSFRESLALRENRTVAAALAALGEPSSEAETASEQECGRAAVLGALTDALGPDARLEAREIAGSGPATLIATVSYEDDGPTCTDTHVFVLDGGCMIEIASASECLYWSYFDQHVSLGDPSFYDGGPELGTVAVLERSIYGRGDSEDGAHVDAYGEGTLVVCAERRAWACSDVSISQRSETDCMGSGGCFDPDDPDSADLPVPTDRGYLMSWRIDGRALVLTLDDSPFTTATVPPQQGRIALTELF